MNSECIWYKCIIEKEKKLLKDKSLQARHVDVRDKTLDRTHVAGRTHGQVGHTGRWDTWTGRKLWQEGHIGR
jgi:hypothetical protein